MLTEYQSRKPTEYHKNLLIGKIKKFNQRVRSPEGESEGASTQLSSVESSSDWNPLKNDKKSGKVIQKYYLIEENGHFQRREVHDVGSEHCQR